MKRYKNAGDGGTGVYIRKETTSSVMATDRPYGEFYEFYSVSPKYFGYTLLDSGSGSSVGIATDYGLNGPGIESRWGRDLTHTSRPALGPTQPPVQWVFQGGKVAGA